MFLKRFVLLITIIVSISCGGAKQVVNSTSEALTDDKNVVNVAMETETPAETTNHSETTETNFIDIDSVATEKTIKTIDSATLIIDPEPKFVSHNQWDALLKKHVTSNGNVDYKGFQSDRNKFYAYIKTLQENIPQESWTKHQTLAYWINAYNAFTVDLILRNYPLQSIKDIKDPWEQRLWKIGDKWYNLNDIEHQILRKMDEPRIHFAIVCASVSCPKLQNTAFHEAMLEEQLENATKEFLSDKSKNIISENSIKLSKIFKWFAKDFKTKDSDLIDFLNQYSDVKISKNVKKSFLEYNWDLNE